MTEAFIVSYFESLAALHPALLHTQQRPSCFQIEEEYNLDEFDQALRSIKSNTALLIELGEDNVGETDAPFQLQPIRLHFLRKSSNDTKAERRAIRNAMKQIAVDFAGMMRKDGQQRYEREDDTDGALFTAKIRFDSNLKFSSMNYVNEVWHGKTMAYTWRAPITLAYNPANWQ